MTVDDRDPPTTGGAIAVANLHAQIDGLTARLSTPRSMQAARTPPAVAEQALLIDLLLLRGHVLGRIVDYERAAGLAEVLVRDTPDDRAAWLARARTRAIFHRFTEARGDLDAAGRRGADRGEMDAERAAILQAVGSSTEALVLRRDAARRRPDLATMGALAVLQAERGEVTEAENLFTKARRHYRSVSPFPVAELDFRRGLMWLGEHDLPAARAWFGTAARRVPAYAPALGHLAKVDATVGAPDAAVERLHALAMSSDDPQYANTLAGVLSDTGRPQEAERWRVRAASRYQELVAHHPDAFAHHVIVVHADQPTKRPPPGSTGIPCPEATVRQERIMLAKLRHATLGPSNTCPSAPTAESGTCIPSFNH